MRINEYGLVEKVKYLFQIAINGLKNEDDVANIIDLSKEHSDYARIGKVFGYSISEYAIATLAWINNSVADKEFKRIYNQLSEQRKKRVQELIESKMYLQY